MAQAFDGQALVDELDKERQSRGLTWHKVAQQAGVPQSTVSRLKAGKTHPSAESLARLHRWLGEGEGGKSPEDFRRAEVKPADGGGAEESGAATAEASGAEAPKAKAADVATVATRLTLKAARSSKNSGEAFLMAGGLLAVLGLLLLTEGGEGS